MLVKADPCFCDVPTQKKVLPSCSSWPPWACTCGRRVAVAVAVVVAAVAVAVAAIGRVPEPCAAYNKCRSTITNLEAICVNREAALQRNRGVGRTPQIDREAHGPQWDQYE